MAKLNVHLTENSNTTLTKQATNQIYAELENGSVSHKKISHNDIHLNLDLSPKYRDGICRIAVNTAIDRYRNDYVHEDYKEDSNTRKPGEDGWLKR